MPSKSTFARARDRTSLLDYRRCAHSCREERVNECASLSMCVGGRVHLCGFLLWMFFFIGDTHHQYAGRVTRSASKHASHCLGNFFQGLPSAIPFLIHSIICNNPPYLSPLIFSLIHSIISTNPPLPPPIFPLNHSIISPNPTLPSLLNLSPYPFYNLY